MCLYSTGSYPKNVKCILFNRSSPSSGLTLQDVDLTRVVISLKQFAALHHNALKLIMGQDVLTAAISVLLKAITFLNK